MVASPRSAAPREHAIAQYLVTKVNWKGSYKRILAVTPASVLTYNPETYACTARWELSEIEDVEVSHERDQFVVRLEKARFRLAKVRFYCAARAHFLSLISKLRRHFAIQPVAFSFDAVQAQWKKYRCIEFFGDGSSQAYYLQVGVSAVILHDDGGRKMDSFPYIYMKKAASTQSHPDGIVLGTPYQERLFLCSNRNECLSDIYLAASALGMDLRWNESPLNVQLLRLRNSQLIDQPAIVCFEVLKASDDGTFFMEVQLLLMGDALVEVHPKLRSVVSRKYAKLLNVIRTEWDVETVGLEFAEGESLVVKLEARDQLIALLLLTCRESGYEHITLTSSEIKKNRVYYPHVIESSTESAAASMESFFVRRVLQTSALSEDKCAVATERSTAPSALARRQTAPESRWLPTRKHAHRKRSEAALAGTRDSFETGESMNDFVSTNIAMEELNANVPLNELSLFCDRDVLNSAIELLAEHLVSLVITLRRFVNAANAEIVTTLQALVRMSYSSHASLPDVLIPRVFDAMHELFTQQDFLVCYWCLKLLQCYFDPIRSEFIYGQRAKILQYASTQRELLTSLIDLLPTSPAASTRSSGFWLLSSSGVMEHMSRHSSMDSTLLSKEARLEKDMNAVYYEALFTVHYITIYLHEKDRQQTGAHDGASNVGSAAQVLREFDSRTAKRRISRATSLVDVSPGVPAKQKRFIAEKLADKHAFLMDAVVDTRLVRACLSCIALIKFLTLELGKLEAPGASTAARAGKTSANTEDAEPNARDGSSSRQAVKDQSLSTDSQSGGDVYVHARRDAPAARRGARFTSFHDVHDAHDTRDGDALPNASVEDALARKIQELNDFLETYATKIRTQSDQSTLFQGQQTIVVPLTGFSQSTDEFAGSDMTQSSEGMKLEHLAVVTDERRKDDPADSGDNSGDCAGKRNGSDHSVARDDNGRRDGRRRSDGDDAHFDHSDEGKSVHKLSALSVRFRAASADAPRSSDVLSRDSNETEDGRVSSRLFRSSTFYFEHQHDETSSSADLHLHHERETTSTAERRESSVPAARPSAQQPRRKSSAVEIRASGAHHCDACIGCNDVCDNVACFFCSEKKYQLQTTFPDSPLTRRRGGALPVQSARRGVNNNSNDDDDSYVYSERTYSSCELKRHRSLRSCWVVVDGAVYDVTDLLSVHPGGLQVLLQAAQQGEDCGAILDEHPPSARRVLSNYRLGEYYECESRTML